MYEMVHVDTLVPSFKSHFEFFHLQMKKVVSREDRAVSPIIATVLLVGITVTMVATAYTLLENYLPNPVAQTPSAALKVVYSSSLNGSLYSGNYSVYINSLNGNVSVTDVNMLITFSNNTVEEVQLGNVYGHGSSLAFNNELNISLQSTGGYIDSTSMLSLSLHQSGSYITRIALVDTQTNGAIGSTLIQ